MNHSDIAALMKGVAPVIADLVVRTTQPLVARIAALEQVIAELRAVDHAATVSDLVADAVGKLPPPADGKDADPALIAQLVTDAVAALPIPEDGQPGKDADPELVAALVDEKVAAAVAALPRPVNGQDADPEVIAALVAEAVAKIPPAPAGKDADPAVVRQMVDVAVAALPLPAPGEPGPAGKDGALPIVRAYEDGVHYAGTVVTHDGATWQASKDTGRAPPHEDWTCIARAGRDGEPGKSFRVRGTHATDAEYLALDVVAMNGAAFVAKQDDPGACPGDGWQMLAMRGKPGAPGEASRVPGSRGDPGPAVKALEIDDEGLLTLRNADGTAAQCDLYPLLSKLGQR